MTAHFSLGHGRFRLWLACPSGSVPSMVTSYRLPAVLVLCAVGFVLACRTPDDADGRAATDSRIAVAPDSLDTACAIVEPVPAAGSRIVSVQFACESPAAVPGQLYPAHRQVDVNADPVEAALRELMRGPSPSERSAGLSSFFSDRTADALRRVTRSTNGDTVTIDFDGDLPQRLPSSPGVTSFLPPGVMAEVTGTVFSQFPEVMAVRLQFDGSERAFWQWLNGEARPFTRRDWERI